MNQIQIGPITIDDTVSMQGDNFIIYFWDERITKGHELETFFPLHKKIVEREAIKRGKLKGTVGYYSDKLEDHEVNFEEWISNVDYREESEKFIQQLVAEILNPFKAELEELRGFKAAHIVKEKIREISSMGQIGRTYQKTA